MNQKATDRTLAPRRVKRRATLGCRATTCPHPEERPQGASRRMGTERGLLTSLRQKADRLEVAADQRLLFRPRPAFQLAFHRDRISDVQEVLDRKSVV